MPVVEAVGVVTERGDGLEAALITRHLDYSLPFRTLFARGSVPDLRRRLLDAGAELLVRLHLGGFFWGDCSLSNTLFRRDAGALAAYLVDAETGEMHPSLSNGQRGHDLMIAEENVAGELADVEAELGREGELAPEETAAELVARYESLWNELTREESFDDTTRFKIDDRLHRLNELGFDVDELELVAGDDGYKLRLNPRVVEPGHHRRRLHALTGLMAQENQARRMLNDLARFRAELDRKGGRPVPETVAVHRWLSEVFEPAVAAVPARAVGQARRRRGLPRGARAPLVSLTAGRPGHRPDAGGEGVRRRRAPARRGRTRSSRTGSPDPRRGRRRRLDGLRSSPFRGCAMSIRSCGCSSCDG